MRDVKRLRRLLDLRRRQEEQSRVQLARSLQKAAEISAEVRDRTQALERALAGEFTSPSHRRHLEELIAISQPAIKAAEAAEASAMAAVDEVRQEWQRATQRLKGMERLEQRRTEEQLTRRERAEYRTLEDTAAGRIDREDQP